MLLVRHARHAVRPVRRRTAAAASVLVLAGVAVALPPSPAAAHHDPCHVPQLREVMVSQGLPSYEVLARGKTTLVKYFFGKPLCAPSDVQVTITGGSLTITQGLAETAPPDALLAQVALPAGALGPIAPLSASPAASSTGDPTFQVPGSLLRPQTASNVLLGFKARFDWVATRNGSVIDSSSVDVTGPQGQPVTARMERWTNPLRLLLVPMGRPNQRSKDWPSTLDDDVEQAMIALGRVLPVADGVAGLTSADPHAGLRYDLAPSPVIADVSAQFVDNKFCGRGSNLSAVASALNGAKGVYESQNGGAASKVDRVVGLVSTGISNGIGVGNCADGYAQFAGVASWARFGEGTPSYWAAVIGMEVAHALGAVPFHRDDNSYHSPSTKADDSAPLRAYNVLSRTYLGTSNRNQLSLSDANFNGHNTLLEPADWLHVMCTLTPTFGASVPVTTACGSPGGLGGVAAAVDDVFEISGTISETTDGTKPRADLHTYKTTSAKADVPPATGPYHFVQRNAAGLVEESTPVAPAHVGSQHASGAPHGVSIVETIDTTIKAKPLTTKIQLYKGDPSLGVLLYERSAHSPPTLGTPDRRFDVSGITNLTGTPVAEETDAALSPDGEFVAVAKDGAVHVRRADGTSDLSNAVQGGEPAWSHDGTRIAFVQGDGSVAVAQVATPAAGTASISEPRKLYDASIQALEDPRASSPTWSPDGSRIAIGLAGDVWTLDTAPLLTSNTVLCRVPSFPGEPCTQATETPERENQPAWAADGRLAYTRVEQGSAVENVWVQQTADRGSERKNVLQGATAAAWGGTRLAAQRAEGLLVVETQDGAPQSAPQHIAAPGDRRPSLDRLGRVVVFDRVDGAGGKRDVFHGLVGTTFTVVASDDAGPQLRLDVSLDCAGRATYPMRAGLKPSSSTPTTATFTFSYESTTSCGTAHVRLRTSDGYSLSADKRLETLHGPSQKPSPTLYSPLPDQVLSQFGVLVASGGAVDASGVPLAEDRLRYSVGRLGSTLAPIGTGSRAVLSAPEGGWEPGQYVLELEAVDAAGNRSTTQRTFTFATDGDRDGVPLPADTTCAGAHADDDPMNVVGDPDGDNLFGSADLAPCATAVNSTMTFDPKTLNLDSSGNTVTITITGTSAPLTSLKAADVSVVALAGFPVSLPATSYKTPTSGTAEVKFDRKQLVDAIRARGVTGLVPISVAARTAAGQVLYGFDRNAPHYS